MYIQALLNAFRGRLWDLAFLSVPCGPSHVIPPLWCDHLTHDDTVILVNTACEWQYLWTGAHEQGLTWFRGSQFVY